MIFTGEIFSLFIIVIAAIETAIALCIVLSYYRITNKNINALKNTTDFYNSIALILSIGETNYTLVSWYGIKIVIAYLISCYI